MDILYGRNPVVEAMRAGRPARKLVVAQGVKPEARLDEILAVAGERGLTVERSPRRRLDDIAHSEHHQGVVGYFHAKPPVQLDDLLDRLRAPALLLVLDGIQDPQNLGALARTAEAVGADGLVMPRHRAATLTPAAVKASAGATEHLPMVSVVNLAQALDRLGAAGVWRVGLAGEAGQRYDEVDLAQPVAVVVGAEGDGLRPITRKNCDVLVTLPMVGRVSSLNAAAAGAAILYEAFRQRGFAAR
ncbi:MAG: 23S rRNA (guanosine(2251)-2'-O)-methyltransferase RlmB [Candidatus Dormibacteria bacterium]